jgi:hypothetical protein
MILRYPANCSVLYDRKTFIVQATGAYTRAEVIKGAPLGQAPALLDV